MIAIPFDVQWGTDIHHDNLFPLGTATRLLGQRLQAVRRRLRGTDTPLFKSRPVLPTSASEAPIDTVPDSTFEVDPSVTSSSLHRTNYSEQIFLLWRK